ncbi:MAG: NAD(P)/FAD-dependent oxidoreductase [Ktedonobacteraceae bacterium]|nr:NAD(P)/FAD-dependent oxidoreductase [Ktedonobacteraceae bacterium]
MSTHDIVSAKHEANATLPHVVIIGAGFGGLQAAKALRNVPVRVTVIDRTNYHLFQPLLYQVATAALSPADICSPIRHILKWQENTRVIMAEVTDIDTQQQRVYMHERSIDYDYLIVATGARENYFGHTAWQALAPGLKTIEDATAIRRSILLAFELAEQETDPQRIRELLTFIVVGAGPTGVELAGAIAEVAHHALKSEFRHIDPSMARILLVELGPRILPSFPESLAQRASKELTHLGVEVRTNAPVSDIDEDGVVILEDHIAAKTVLWTAGVLASPAGQWLGAEVDRAGRVEVEQNLSLPNVPNVFVIGDTARVMQNDKPLPGVAPVAMQQGRHVASVIAHHIAGKQHQPFHYLDKGSLATVGRAYAIVDLGKLRMAGFIAWLLWLAVHIVYLIDFRNRVLVMLQWAWAYFTWQRGARLITYADQETMRQEATQRKAEKPVA